MLVATVVSEGHDVMTVVPVKPVLDVIVAAPTGIVHAVETIGGRDGDATEEADGKWLNCAFNPVVDRSIIQSDGCISSGIVADVPSIFSGKSALYPAIEPPEVKSLRPSAPRL